MVNLHGSGALIHTYDMTHVSCDMTHDMTHVSYDMTHVSYDNTHDMTHGSGALIHTYVYIYRYIDTYVHIITLLDSLHAKSVKSVKYRLRVMRVM